MFELQLLISEKLRNKKTVVGNFGLLGMGGGGSYAWTAREGTMHVGEGVLFIGFSSQGGHLHLISRAKVIFRFL